MTDEPTYESRYLCALASFTCDPTEQRIFESGYIYASAALVAMGVMRAAIVQATDANNAHLHEVCTYVCELYNEVQLSYAYVPTLQEFFVFQRVNTPLVDEVVALAEELATGAPTPEAWEQYHLRRARLCGVPLANIDMRYHLRPAVIPQS